MSILKFFFPESARERLSPSTRRRIPFLVGMDLILFVYFLSAALIRYRAEPGVFLTFLIAVSCTEILFVLSLAFIRMGKYRLASYIGGLGPIINVIWIGVLLPYKETGDIYRLGIYLMASVVANSLVALDKRQVNYYVAGGIVLFPVLLLFAVMPQLGGMSGDLLSIAVSLFLLHVAVCLVVLFMARLNYELQEVSEAESARNRERAEALAALVEGSRSALSTGQELNEVARKSRDRSMEIRGALESLGGEARDLSGNASGAEATNRDLVARADGLKAAVAEENALLEETSAALGRIAATVQSLADLAVAKKGTISSVLATTDHEMRDLESLKGGVERVTAASARVLAASSGISDISESIGLLAMNASIEAAHAGTAGKGFAVISQEVRKLAEQTKTQTAQIAEALKESDLAARSSADSVERFARDNGDLSGNVRDTFDALGAILEGLAAVTRESAELDGRAKELVALAHRSGGEVDESVKGIGAGAANLGLIKDFSGRLARRVNEILADFASIEHAVEEAVRVSAQSSEHMAALDSRLIAIEEKR